jgi:peptidoglycan/xylan/chitin deacetylase (PgdA/CDA1 family)
MTDTLFEDYSFALCLTHDIDRPYKRLHHALYYGLGQRSSRHLRSIFEDGNPYWQFEHVAALEDDLGVRSAFYVLDEPHLFTDRSPREWLVPENWVQYLGRYDITSTAIAETIRDLQTRGWEVGLHGSFKSAEDPGRMRAEKQRLSSVLQSEPRGVRQHHLRLSEPETWEVQSALGFEYDASVGSGTEYGFGVGMDESISTDATGDVDPGYGLLRPLENDFVVFPLTLMEQALPDPGKDFETAWNACLDLLEEAQANAAVMTVLWHPRFFSQTEFPGYTRLYRRLVEHAQKTGAWVGSPGSLLDALDDRTIDEIATAPVVESSTVPHQ